MLKHFKGTSEITQEIEDKIQNGECQVECKHLKWQPSVNALLMIILDMIGTIIKFKCRNSLIELLHKFFT